jgi:NADPH2:quinone reductase
MSTESHQASSPVRRLQVTGPGQLELVECARIGLPLGHARVEVRAVGLNFRDVKQWQSPPPDLPLPFTPGSDYAGVIVEIDDKSSPLAVGDHVVGMLHHGASASELVVPTDALIPIDDDVDLTMAAIAPVSGLTASFLIDAADVQSGDVVVVRAAAGGLGCFLGGLLKARGAQTIGLTSTKEKAAIASEAGYDEVIVRTTGDEVAAVRSLTTRGGRTGVDIVVDSVGGKRFVQSFEMLANEGSVVLCGRSAGEPDLQSVQRELINSRRNLGLREFFLNTHIADRFDEVIDRLMQVIGALEDNTIRVPVASVDLGAAPAAFEAILSGSTAGKTALTFSLPQV